MYVYILKCEGNLLYTGIAVNPEKRLRQHLGITKGGAKFTQIHRVQKVMAIWHDESEQYARKLEYFIKNKLTRIQKQMLVDNHVISFSDYGFDAPSDAFVYVSPDELNLKYNLNTTQSGKEH